MRLSILMLVLVAAPTLSVVAQTKPDDPHYRAQGSWQEDMPDQWAVQALGVYESSQRPMRATAPGAPLVAVIDTGIDLHHEDLDRQRLWRNPAEQPNGRDDDQNGYVDDLIGWNFVDHNNRPHDRSGHGTHVSGIIGACTDNGVGIAAVAPSARIMALKVAHFAGQARSTAIAAAIDYAWSHDADVINLSMGGSVATALEAEAVARAQQAGVLVVVSAGNEGDVTDRFGFAGLPGVLVVGASTPQGERAAFSNFGGSLALLAPGVDVLSLRAADTDFIALTGREDYVPETAVVGNQGRYYRASGTSFSAALVSGLAARLLAHRSDLDAQGLARVLRQGAQDIAPMGVDQRSGYGLASFTGSAGQSAHTFVDARISRLALQADGDRVLLVVYGVAAANALKATTLALASQSDDTRWQPLSLLPAPSAAQGAFAAVALDSVLAAEAALGSVGNYWLRLRVENMDGLVREARAGFALPAPRGDDT